LIEIALVNYTVVALTAVLLSNNVNKVRVICCEDAGEKLD